MEELAIEVPAAAQLATAAHVGHSEDEPAVEQRQTHGGKRWVRGDFVGPVAIDDARGSAVDRSVTVAHQRHRNERAVAGSHHTPLAYIAGGIEVAKHRLALTQCSSAGDEVVVKNAGWGRERRIRITEKRCVEVGVGGGPHAMDRLGLINHHGLAEAAAIIELNDTKTLQSIEALMENQVTPKYFHAFKLRPAKQFAAGCDKFVVGAPLFGGGDPHRVGCGVRSGIGSGRHRYCHLAQPEVFGAVVGHDEETFAAVRASVMVHAVFDVLLTRPDEHEAIIESVGPCRPNFGGDLTADCEEDPLIGGAHRHPAEEPLIGFLENEIIFDALEPHQVSPHLIWTHSVILRQVEKRCAIGRPHRARSRFLNDVGQVESSGEITDVEFVDLIA